MHKKVVFVIFFILTMAALQAQASQMRLRAQNINCTMLDDVEYCKSEKGNVLDGKVAVKRKNGTVGSISEFKNGYRNGESFIFDGKGRLIERLVFSKGIMDGVDVFYHRNGKIWIVAPYMKGLLSGPVDIFNSNGKRRGQLIYKKGILKRGYCRYFEKQIDYPNKTSEVAFNQLVTCGGR